MCNRPASHNRLLEKLHWCSCNNNVSLLSQFGRDDMVSIRAIVWRVNVLSGSWDSPLGYIETLYGAIVTPLSSFAAQFLLWKQLCGVILILFLSKNMPILNLVNCKNNRLFHVKAKNIRKKTIQNDTFYKTYFKCFRICILVLTFSHDFLQIGSLIM